MNCGCCKDLGCFPYNYTISFPTSDGNIVSLGDNGPYIFHIWSNGSYQRIEETFLLGEALSIPFTFNENSETTIKIEIPTDYQDISHGFAFVTTADGACCFTVHGLISQCS
jgi:hypothetical protein